MPKYKNPGIIRFRGKLEQSTRSGAGAWIVFPKDVEKLFGTRGRVPVQVTYDGIPYRGSMVKMNPKDHLLLVLKEIREKLEKKRGDTVTVTVRLDEVPRVIKLSADASRVLKKSARAFAVWKNLAYSHQRQFHLAIEEAKTPETRNRRIKKMIQELLAWPVKKKTKT